MWQRFLFAMAIVCVMDTSLVLSTPRFNRAGNRMAQQGKSEAHHHHGAATSYDGGDDLLEIFPNPDNVVLEKLPSIYAIMFTEQAKEFGISVDELLGFLRIGLNQLKREKLGQKEEEEEEFNMDKSCVDLFGISLPQVNYAAERIGIAANAAMSTYNEEMEKLKQSPNIAEQVIHMKAMCHAIREIREKTNASA